MAQYCTLSLSQVDSEDEDIISYLCFKAGASGVSEDLDFIQHVDNYEPQTFEQKTKNLSVYFSVPPPRKFVEELIQRFPQIKITQSIDDEKDWCEEWKKGLRAFLLTDNVWVVPSWLEVPSGADKVIKIDPGMAFGTGTHETTRIAAEFISQIHFKQSDCLLDVGTGTGILLMLANHYGCEKCVGLEIDEVAREVARENIRVNRLKQNVQILNSSLAEVNGEFNVVVANIIDGVLISLASDLKKKTRSGGELILTGILEGRRTYFIEAFDFSGFEVVNEKHSGEWVGFHLKKR